MDKATIFHTHRAVACPFIRASSARRGTGVIATSAEILLAIITSIVVGTITSKATRALGTGGRARIIAELVAKINVAAISYPTVLLIKMRKRQYNFGENKMKRGTSSAKEELSRTAANLHNIRVRII